jgi:hypothetical protein
MRAQLIDAGGGMRLFPRSLHKLFSVRRI